MIKRCTKEDAELIDRLMTDRSIWEFISDDMCHAETFTVHELLVNNRIYVLLIDNESLFLFLPINGITYDVHVCILPNKRGEMAINNSRQAYNFMFQNTVCQKIIAHIPCFNRKAYALSVRCGFRFEGINRKSFLKHGSLYDQIMMGLCKEEVLLCPQRQQ